MTDPIANFFTPRGVVVIGASNNPTKLGYRLACNLIDSGYRGAIHLVNSKGGLLRTYEMYRSIAEVPDPVDLAVLLIPAEVMAAALHECGERGIQSAIISSGGFREVGAEGARREAECLQVAKHYGMRLIGPNCVGVIDTHTPLDTSFLPPPGAAPGEVAFISHSGAVCDVVIDWGRGQGLGLSRLISLGNQVDLTEADMLAPVAADPQTNVIALYMEGVQDGGRFIREASRITRLKPIVAIKVGRSASGQRAASSHTGALAGQDVAFDAAFRRAGVLRAPINEDLYHWAHALAWCPLPQGRNLAILTNAGGPGVIAADAAEQAGLHLTDLQPATTEKLGHLLPAAASLHNPVDMLGSATAEQYAECLALLLADVNVHSIIVIIPPPPLGTATEIADQIIPVIGTSHKPVVVALMGGASLDEAAHHFQAARVPEYRFPEQAVSSQKVLVQRAEFLAEPVSGIEPLTGLDCLAAWANFGSEKPDVFGALEAYGIATAAGRFASTPAQAAEVAQSLGFPVVLKVVSPQIVHKSDAGGVLLNLKGAEAVRQGFETIAANTRKIEALFEGVLVQRMIPAGQEVIVGMVRDPQFGPLMMFGSGGVEVEGLHDITFELAPLSVSDAQKMIERTWAGKKLGGFRNTPPADQEAVIDVLRRLAQLALDFPEITEIEINPLRVLPQGAVAVDARQACNGQKTDKRVETDAPNH